MNVTLFTLYRLIQKKTFLFYCFYLSSFFPTEVPGKPSTSNACWIIASSGLALEYLVTLWDNASNYCPNGSELIFTMTALNQLKRNVRP